ncbi:MAG: cob(I)yrinic acid a,c-diamide adenosyltransferase [Ignavibacteriae bacterium]|nr:cob(I)yrinic acid a,c-diamide adenosyltransferase [Ignavibacteriota bacterium]
MKIYTKTGDEGKTSLFGGQRVLKDDLRIEAYGTTDELNALIGVVLSEALTDEISDLLIQIQNDLFIVGAELATPKETRKGKSIISELSKESIDLLENAIDEFEEKLPSLKSFILPSGIRSASLLHFARTVCRRAERNVVKLAKEVELNENVVMYLNRLSDLLFVLARNENFRTSTVEVEWKTRG